MAAVYCVGFLSPEQLISKMQKQHGQSYDKFTIVPFGKKLSLDKKYRKNIIITCHGDAVRNISILNRPQFRDKNIFIFCSPYRCMEFEGAIWLDFEYDVDARDITFVETHLNYERRTEKTIIKRRHDLYSDAVIEKIKNMGSILNGLMTLVYSLPKRSMQKPVTASLCYWLYNDGSPEQIDALFDRLKTEANVSRNKRDKFKTLLLSEIGNKVKAACKLIKQSKDRPDFESISKEIGIHDYDLRYIMKIVSADKEFPETDNIRISSFYKKAIH